LGSLERPVAEGGVVVDSTLSDIINYIKSGALRDAEASAVALRDEHLPELIRAYHPKHKKRDRCPIYVPHRDVTLRVTGMATILVSQLRRNDAEGALYTAKDMGCAWLSGTRTYTEAG
jgi:hypothetical protein